MDRLKQRVLFVDDEEEIRLSAGMWLSAAGYETSYARDGVEGISVAGESKPDAIVLDIRMPRKDGMTVLTELQQRADTRHIPVVMLSASLVDQQRALESGARFFLSKPYSRTKLVAAVSAAIGGRSGRRESASVRPSMAYS